MPLQRSRSYLLEDPRHRKAEADRLDRQAQVLFPFERGALAHHGLAAGHTLVDLGCGQGSYLALVAGAFPGTRCIGLDRNAALLEEAARRPGIAAVARCDIATPAELLPALERYRPDVALCRFVLQHMSPDERLSMLTAMAAHARAVPLRLILADVDGASSFVDPPSALLAEARAGLNEIQARNGGDRSVGGRLPDLLEEAGFKEIESSRVRVTSDAVGFAAWWRAFGSLLCLGLRSRPSAQQALLEWAADPQTAQRFRAGFDVCFASSAGNRAGTVREAPQPGDPASPVPFELSRYEQRDRAALLDFRLDHYGSKAVQADPAYVDWQFRDAPGIPEQGAPLHVAKSGGRIVGTMGKIRTSLYVRGEPAPAAWVVDFAVSRELRRTGIGEAIAAISRKDGATGLSLEGTAASRGITRRFLYRFIAEVPLFVRPLDPVRWLRSHHVPAPLAWLASPALPALAALESAALRSARRDGLELVETPAFDARADALFAALARRYPVLCRRDRGWLEWRFERYPRRGRYRLYWLLRSGEVAGYAVLRPGTHHGVPAGALSDYLCLPELIRPLLGLTLQRFRDMGAAVVTCLHLNAAGSRAFRSVGFLRRSSGWQFLARPETPALAEVILDPRNWFLTFGDSNVDRERDPV